MYPLGAAPFFNSIQGGAGTSKRTIKSYEQDARKQISSRRSKPSPIYIRWERVRRRGLEFPRTPGFLIVRNGDLGVLCRTVSASVNAPNGDGVNTAGT